MGKEDKFTKAITRRYYIELGASLAAYVVILFPAIAFMGRSEGMVLKSIIILAPMIPICFATIAIYRHVMRMDEFQRFQTLKVITVAAAGTALLSMGYGFLELVGLPKLSMMAVWPVMGTLWFLTNFILRLFGRHHP